MVVEVVSCRAAWWVDRCPLECPLELVVMAIDVGPPPVPLSPLLMALDVTFRFKGSVWIDGAAVVVSSCECVIPTMLVVPLAPTMTGNGAVVLVIPLTVTVDPPFTLPFTTDALLRFRPFSGAVVNLSVGCVLPLCASDASPLLPLVVNERGTTDDTDSEDGVATVAPIVTVADEGGVVEVRCSAGLPRLGEDTDRTGEIVVCSGRLPMDAFVAMLDRELLELYRTPFRPGIIEPIMLFSVR